MSNGRNWALVDDVTLRRLVAAGLNDHQIGALMHRHHKLIGLKRRENGLRPGQSAVFTAVMARVNARRRMARA